MICVQKIFKDKPWIHNCTLLYCTVLYCTVLHCTVQYITYMTNNSLNSSKTKPSIFNTQEDLNICLYELLSSLTIPSPLTPFVLILISFKISEPQTRGWILIFPKYILQAINLSLKAKFLSWHFSLWCQDYIGTLKLYVLVNI